MERKGGRQRRLLQFFVDLFDLESSLGIIPLFKLEVLRLSFLDCRVIFLRYSNLRV